MKRFELWVGVGLFAAACHSEFVSQVRDYQPAVLRRFTTDSIDFTTPDTVALATNFAVSVTTYGGPCDEKDETQLTKIAVDSAHFVPVNVTVTQGGVCPSDDLTKSFVHSGTLQFNATGHATVTVLGRDADGTTMARTRSVFVRP